MEQTVTYQCPNCGAGLTFDAQKQLFACEFCLSEFTREQVLEANSEEKQREKDAEEAAYNAQMNEYECRNCGAHIMADENTVASFCAYCHNPIVLIGKLSGEMKPQKVIPFKYDKEAAKSRFLAFVKKKWFVPKAFFRPEQVERISGVYYPFWVADADTDSVLDAHATRVRRWRSGNKEYCETSEFRIHRRGKIHFEDITVSANSEEDKQMLEGILPFPSEALTEFSVPYLSGYTAKKRNLESREVRGEVKARINGYANRILRDTIGSYSTVSIRESGSRVLASHWDYSLLPIWILTYKSDRGKIYTYAMNGHTGKVFGELPVSRWKLALFGAGIALLATLILTFLGGLMLS